ncbi:MAG: hypothetical protein A2V93_02425 [Ignavibacteria bacterium RBG_16_34_14]|nr:MAG: hypothetical protein A2V93_02425 [Ignavibacteria bacterium RBG_16_34_14]
MIILFILFFSSLLLLLHSYILYPISVWVLTIFIKKKFSEDNNYLPNISILISVYNEEKVINKTLRTLQNCYYPKEKVEILVGSDNSTDKTNDILEKLSQEFENIKVFNFNKRRGKPHVINDLAEAAKGEILIFCDANTLYDKEAIKNLVKNYNDARIGGVSGKLNLIDFEKAKKSGSQEKIYWDAETWLKKQEGKLGVLIGANGGIYSIRKEYFEKIPTIHPVMDDFYISLKVIEKRKAFLYINDAIAEEYTAPIRAEFNRKIRNNSIMMSTIKVIKRLLNPSFGLIAYGLWSHKIIRWFTPILLLLIFVTNYALINEGAFYRYFFLIQLLFYVSSIVGYIFIKLNVNVVPLLMSFYFVMTNAAMFIGLVKFLFKKQTAFWQSTPR